MRSPAHPAALAVLVLMLLPAGAAQLLSDPAGDHAPAGFEEGDLLALEAEVADGQVHFRIQTGGLDAPTEVALVDSSTYQLRFSHGAADYGLYLTRRIVLLHATEGPAHDATLYRLDGDLRRDLPVEVAFSEETDAGVLTVSVPAAALVDEADVPLLPGRALTDLWVESSNEADTIRRAADEDGASAAVTVHDRMPDDGAGGPLRVRVGPDGGTLTLLPEAPVRSSNGGPTTFVFDVRVHNAGAEARTVDLRVEDVPETWDALVVPATVDVGPGESGTVRVVVDARGRHAHGGEDVLRLVAHGAEAPLIVRYPEVPQPAGHHDTVWFHNARRYDEGSVGAAVDDVQGTVAYDPSLQWMNTLGEDPADERRTTGMTYLDGPEGWRFVLSPGLVMGLDLHDGAGEVVFPLTPSGPTDLEGVRLSARLWLETPNGSVDLAAAPETQPLRLPADAVTEVVLDLRAVADRVAPAPNVRLLLDVVLESYPTDESSAFARSMPTLAPGGHARLPLDEYRDAIPPDVRAALEEGGAVVDEDGTVRAPAPGPAPGNDSPGAAAPVALAVLAATAVSLRRRGT